MIADAAVWLLLIAAFVLALCVGAWLLERAWVE